MTASTSTPIHTGEQIYLRQNFRDLIERQAVRVVGPDPCDVGGIAELKWVAEYADMHGVLMAPHGVFDGLLGLAALVQVAATLPDNFIAFEYPVGQPDWWYEIVEGLPDPIVRDGLHRRLGPPGNGRPVEPGSSEAAPRGRRSRVLRLTACAEGELYCDQGRRDRGHGTGEQHPGTRSEVLVDEAEQWAAECRGADEDEQVYTHDPAADRVGSGHLHGGVRGGQQEQRARASGAA